MLTKIRI